MRVLLFVFLCVAGAFSRLDILGDVNEVRVDLLVCSFGSLLGYQLYTMILTASRLLILLILNGTVQIRLAAQPSRADRLSQITNAQRFAVSPSLFVPV